MEKTLRIFKQEAYIEGYNDARNSIAKEIEDVTIFYPHRSITGEMLTETTEIMNDLRTRFSIIAKGKPKVETNTCYFCQGEGILQSDEDCLCVEYSSKGKL